MKIVKVIDVPVRYEGKTYRVGNSFKMKIDHINENIVEVIGVEKESEPRTELGDLTIDEIKVELDKLGVAYKSKDKKEDLLKLMLQGPEE